ncbi:MAG: Gfo/Idh/MocA family oxidoreductase [Bryobacteraceae bacterium]
MKTDRREFLSAALASQAAFAGPNDRIRIAVLGCGGRARHLLGALKKITGAEVVGVADVWDSSLEQSRPFATSGAFFTKEYREALERKDVDAVLIASPDHWHVPMTVDACAAGKDVYVEKPLTHDLSEGPRVIEAQNRYKRIVQVGTQQRSMPHIAEARQIVQSGQLGRVHKVHMTWNRNAPRGQRVVYDIDPKTVDWKRFLGSARPQPFDEYRFRNWRWFWDFGNGILTDLMVHWLDTVHWILDLDKPDTAMSMGDQFASKGVWETPDTIQTFLHYRRQQVQAYFEGTFINQHNAAMTEIMGSDATLYIDRGRYEIHPEPNNKKGIEYREKILGKGRRGADFFDQPDGELLHLTDWLDAIRTRRAPSTPAEAGVSAAAAAHYGNMAYRTGRVVDTAAL